MYTVNFDDTQAINALNRLAEAGGNLKPVMREIREYLLVSTKERFKDGVAPDGTAWQANSDLTARLKGHNKPLIGETKRLSNEIFVDSDAHSVTIGSALIYAGVQQFGAKKREFGGKAPWGDIPARPFLGVSDKDAEQIEEIVYENLADSLRG